MYTKSDWFDQWGVVGDDDRRSVTVTQEEILDKSISDGAFVLLLWIRSVACHGDLRSSSKDLLARDLGVTLRCLNNRLAELVDSGYLNEYHGTWLGNTNVGHVYFIQAATGGPIKIGKATDIGRRLANLQTTHHEALAVIASIDNGGLELEKELHNRFAQYRIRGEWFEPADELLEFINSI